MKVAFTIVIALISLNTSFGQIAFYDAIEINKLCNPRVNKTTNKAVLLIDSENIASLALKLQSYKSDNSIPLNKTAIDNLEGDSLVALVRAILKGNPFLSTSGSAQSDGEKSLSNLSFSSITANNPNALSASVWGEAMADFLISRAKAELTMAFFDRFKNYTEANPEVKLLFPKTCDRMANLLDVEYQRMLEVLREAFIEDLDNLQDGMIKLIDYIGERDSLPGLQVISNSLRHVKNFEFLSAPEFVADLPEITNIPSITNQTDWHKSLDASLKLTAIFSNSMRGKKHTSDLWAPSKEVYEKLLKSENETVKYIYLGLIYQQIKAGNIEINGALLANSIKSNPGEMQWYMNQVSDLVSITEYIVSMAKATESEKTDMTGYLDATMNILDFGNGIFSHYATGDKGQKYSELFANTYNIYRYSKEKEYSSAVIESVDLLNGVYAMASGSLQLDIDSKEAEIKKLKETGGKDPGKKKALQANIDEATDKQKELKQKSEWIDKLTTYGTFMVSMVDAKTSAEAMAIIESAALPVGGSSIRKVSNFSFNLSAYLGAKSSFASTDDDASGGFDGRWFTTITAPIGIDVAYGFNKWGALSFNATLLDVGAIVDYRLSNDSTSISSEIEWGNIFSPGVGLMYGLPSRLPIAIGINAQYGPGLSNISSDVVTLDKPIWRYGVLIVVDLPLFNFYNSPKRRKTEMR